MEGLIVSSACCLFSDHTRKISVDTPLSESRFSEYLKGWVDETREDDHIEEHFMNQE